MHPLKIRVLELLYLLVRNGKRSVVEFHSFKLKSHQIGWLPMHSVVRVVSISNILSGAASIPFSNISAWRSAQQDCSVMRRAHAHLTQGTCPAKKAKNLKELQRYLNCASLDSNGVLIIHKQDPFLHLRKLILVPSHILSGVLTALHIYLQHSTAHQFKKVFKRFYYAINSDSEIDKVTGRCDQCNFFEMYSMRADKAVFHSISNHTWQRVCC